MLSVPVVSKGKRLFYWNHVKVAHNNHQIPLFQFYQLLRHFEWTGFWVNGDFTLTHRFHTFLDFLKCTRKKTPSMSWHDLSHYFGTDVSTGFLAIAKFVECFAHLMLVWPLLSTKSDLLAFYLSKLHPVRANISVPWWTAWSDVREKEKSTPLRSSVRGISTCLSQLYGDSFHFSPCHLQTLRMKGSEWKFLALKLPLH